MITNNIISETFILTFPYVKDGKFCHYAEQKKSRSECVDFAKDFAKKENVKDVRIHSYIYDGRKCRHNVETYLYREGELQLTSRFLNA